jgi:uncharacterized protein (TIGR02246 family)
MSSSNINDSQVVADVVTELEKAWNAADGVAFARPFAEDADFVNIRGEHHRTREAIAQGHQAIFNTVYKGSVVRLQLDGLRALAPGILLAHVKSTLKAPMGPLAGEHRALFSLVLVRDQDRWRIAAFHNTLVT